MRRFGIADRQALYRNRGAATSVIVLSSYRDMPVFGL
jgi:hypothetical protein